MTETEEMLASNIRDIKGSQLALQTFVMALIPTLPSAHKAFLLAKLQTMRQLAQPHADQAIQASDMKEAYQRELAFLEEALSAQIPPDLL